MKRVLSSKIIETIGEYTIVKTKERMLDINCRPYGKVQTWFDVCLDGGDGDIIMSGRILKEARNFIKED